jgi:tetratricopeptide (TPR) repeat protein
MAKYYDLGPYSRPVTTPSKKAQKWFDRGLMWCFGYHHEEAVACFERAIKADPGCAMAWWGIGYASGCNYNKPWEAFDEKDATRSVHIAHNAARRAQELANDRTTRTSDVERAMIGALIARYPAAVPAKDMAPWNDEFASAMREVHARFPQDLDVAAFFCEAIMNRTPWALWDLETGGVAEGADTLEAIKVIEAVLDTPAGMSHPGLLHLYLHLMEMSPHPERALKAADALRALVPDAGHLRHMPTHIDVLCGHYERVVASNEQAIVADCKYLKKQGPLNFYSLYRCHNYHFKIYGAMFLGQYGPAIKAAEDMVATLPEELLRTPSPPMADWLEGFVSVRQHVLIRFGKWAEIIAQPLPDNSELFCVTTAMIHYAKAVAFAATGHVASARAEAGRFELAVENVPASRTIFNNTCLDILAVARQMMLGEIAYRENNFEAAFDHLRAAVEQDDTLPYDEPWGWMQPARHALGALLLEQGHLTEAAAVYRADLGLDDTLARPAQHPDNVWSLTGYHECLVRLDQTEQARLIGQRLALAAARTDVNVRASCFCKRDAISVLAK